MRKRETVAILLPLGTCPGDFFVEGSGRWTGIAADCEVAST